MAAFQLRWCGDRFGRDDWRDSGEALAWETYLLYKEDETFPEFNSPDLYTQSRGSSGMLALIS